MLGANRKTNDARAANRPAKLLAAVIFVVALCFCGICGKVLLDARYAAWERAGEVAAGLVSTITSEIARNIESYDLSLQAVIENLAYPEIVEISRRCGSACCSTARQRQSTFTPLHSSMKTESCGWIRGPRPRSR